MKHIKYPHNIIFLLLMVLISLPAAAADPLPSLNYTETSNCVVPIPPAEKNIQTIEARPYFKVSRKGLQLEAPAFDTKGNLYFVEVFGGKIFRLTPDKKLTVVSETDELSPAGIAIHKNGRIFIAGLGNFSNTGRVVTMNADGTDKEVIVSSDGGYLPDDLVFNIGGGFYFTDFSGTATQPKGGVYYVSSDFDTITKVLPNISIANGIAISPNGNVLWVTEFGQSRLLRIVLKDATTIAPFGATVAYYFTGTPDSIRTDVDGNVYVAMYGQGRVLVLNKSGVPIGQILVPGRCEGHNLRSTSMAFEPGTNKLLILTNDANKGQGSTIFVANGFSKGTKLYSHTLK